MDTIIIQEKINQAVDLLNEFGLDLWLTFVRETTAAADPVLPLIYGNDLTWQSALLVSRTGEKIAIVGFFELEAAQRTGAYTQVIPYHQSIRQPLLETLERLNPAHIGINTSTDDVHADGLTLGMHRLLLSYLENTPFVDRLVSAEKVVGALRSRKTPTEIKRIQTAINTTEKIYAQTFTFMRPGQTEKEVGAFMHHAVELLGLETSWQKEHCPAVNSGPDSPVGHAGPTGIQLEPGHLVHFDFGVKQEGYCSDIQRMVYLLRPGELTAPGEVQKGFQTIVNAIRAAVTAIKPGITGLEIDRIARDVVTNAGYPEYMYATGHHMGRTVHDGAGILGPMWERYGNTPNFPIEPGHVYTVEPGLFIPGYGYIGLEEDIIVTESGAEFLSQFQTELVLI
jgi:Xaa-Pro aminopeptidase